MFRYVLACAVIVAGLLVVGSTIQPAVGAMPSPDEVGCGLCTKDDDCGTGHKCCSKGCDSGRYRCIKCATCPK